MSPVQTDSHHKQSSYGLSWWIMWDCPDGSFGTSSREPRARCWIKISRNWFPTESWKSETYISLVSPDAQLQILLLSTAKENTHEGLVVSLKTSKKHELLYFIFESNSMLCYCCSNTSVCILIEGGNILRVWPLGTENFKLGIIHTTYFICSICICIPGFLYSHWSTVPSVLSNTVTFIIKPNALGLYMGVEGEQEEL